MIYLLSQEISKWVNPRRTPCIIKRCKIKTKLNEINMLIQKFYIKSNNG